MRRFFSGIGSFLADVLLFGIMWELLSHPFLHPFIFFLPNRNQPRHRNRKRDEDRD